MIIINNIMNDGNDNQFQIVRGNIYMSQEERFQEVLNQLKKAGYRITEQRKLLLHIILNNEYSSCKEIYYAAKKQDDKVGIATVYRTVQLLEDMELIHREEGVVYDAVNDVKSRRKCIYRPGRRK